MDKKLFATRKEIYNKCPSIFWEVSIFALILAIAVAAIEAVIPVLSLPVYAFIFFPVLFATYMTLYTIKFGGTVTVKSTFAISRSYFSRSNFGCFRLIRCFFHAVLVEIIASIFVMLIFEKVYTNLYGATFVEQLSEFVDALYNNPDVALDILSNDSYVTSYYNYSVSISYSIAVISFVFGVCYNSVNVYLCANIPNATATFCTTIFNRFLKTKGKSYRKDFWSLNWPLFLLLLAGMVSGYVLTYVLDIDSSYVQVISSMIGLVFIIPFAPFFFAGTEALFAKYCEDMKKASADLTKGFLRNIQRNVNLSEEDKAKIEELLSKKTNEDIEPKDENDEEK